MKISWRENKTNEEVLKMSDEQLYIIATIKKKPTLITHNNIHRLILGGPLEGERSIGRSKNGVDDTYQKWTDMRYGYLSSLAQDREQWRVMNI